jgi:hypothetical protein
MVACPHRTILALPAPLRACQPVKDNALSAATAPGAGVALVLSENKPITKANIVLSPFGVENQVTLPKEV